METRVSLDPAAVSRWVKLGASVVVETGAGEAAGGWGIDEAEEGIGGDGIHGSVRGAGSD